ncbi:MAG: hypothetical protein K2J38_02600 [Muribaculaceae bacterium]|nr:hypothetical protein [Muribaculaceae bacterium]
MKIFCIHFEGAPGGGRATAIPGADSAILRPGEPVFIPDDTERWESFAAPAIRISRLGTAIKARQARAYFDAVSVMHVLRPKAGCKPFDDIDMPPYTFDRTFAPGAWIELGNATDDTEFAIRLSRSLLRSDRITEESEVTFSISSVQACKAVELLSRMATFKTGDIIVFTEAGTHPHRPELDSKVCCTINGTECLSIRLK